MILLALPFQAAPPMVIIDERDVRVREPSYTAPSA